MLFQTLRISNTTLVLINLFLPLFVWYHSLLGLACDVQIWPQCWKMSPQKSNYWWVSFAFEPPGNSSNRHMAGEEFWRGNNNSIVAPKFRMKMGTDIWKTNILYLYKFGKRLSKLYLYFNIDHWKWENLGYHYLSIYVRTGKSSILVIGPNLF